ncbi:unnamed protein product [Musa acuminata subsp. malaccensis]|uniref:(wild Malaysian banana) hypothetical protein n=1 Tax=Musa acuminata subsp. malaccensis TaxID=214687 RepID=A0A804IDC9_MUSAM|nr:unnamed protein product [Musa acuminata subsp. malaccensis]
MLKTRGASDAFLPIPGSPSSSEHATPLIVSPLVFVLPLLFLPIRSATRAPTLEGHGSQVGYTNKGGGSRRAHRFCWDLHLRFRRSSPFPIPYFLQKSFAESFFLNSIITR